jgi:hypothetical protein
MADRARSWPVAIFATEPRKLHAAAAVILHDLRAAGLPVTTAWCPSEAALH